MVFGLHSSLIRPFMLSNEKVWTRNSHRSDTGQPVSLEYGAVHGRERPAAAMAAPSTGSVAVRAASSDARRATEGAAVPHVAIEEGALLLGRERRVPVPVHAPVALHDGHLGIAPLLFACGGSPSWPGGRWRLGLPHRKSAATRPAILAGRCVVSPIIGRGAQSPCQAAHSAKDDFYGETGAEENSPTPAYRKPLCHLSTICEDRTRSHSHSC